MSKIVAIEVTPQAIRAAEVNRYNTKKAKIIKTGEISLEPGVAGESSVEDVPLLVQAFKELWANAKFTTKDVAVIIGGVRFTIMEHATFTQDLKILKNILRMENPNAVPEQFENPIWDFFPTHAYEEKNKIKTAGLVISYESEYISEIASAIRQAKLNIEYVDFAPMAIARYLKNTLDLDNYVLANIRDESTDIVLLRDGVPRSITITPIGLDPEKRNLGSRGIEASTVTFDGLSIQESAAKTIARAIDTTLKSQDDELLVGIDTIFISGPRANDLELKHYLELGLNLKVVPLFIGQTFEVEHEADIDGNRINSNVSFSTPEDNAMEKPIDSDGEIMKYVEPAFDEFVAMCGGIRFNG